MKKIFGVLVARNENDIIESFLRYNLTYLDGMLVYENKRSVDDTREIIEKIIKEGLPVYFTDYLADDFGNNLYDLANVMAKIAIDEYGADLIVRLDTDEFLYHIDGINPRGTLEALREDIEYQIPWRTYVYEKEPDIKLGFMPNNFTQYRNPALEAAQGHAGTTIASKYLIQEKKSAFGVGAHWLQYPDEYRGSVQIENPEKLVCAHFPIRSKAQILKRTVPNWITKWCVSSNFPRHLREGKHQLGLLYNDLKEDGEITPDKMNQQSLEYSVRNVISNLSANDLKRIEKELGDNLTVYGPMDVSICADKLKLRYTRYKEDNKYFLRATLKEIDKTVMFLSSESDKKSEQLQEITQSLTRNCFIFFDTGSGYSENEKQSFSFTGNEVEISCQVPESTVAVRLDPVEGYGCVISNPEILSYGGIVKYEPINGFMDKAGNLVFTNTDPQIELHGAAYWLKIKYRVLILSDFSHYSFFDKILNDYTTNDRELTGLRIECDKLLNEREYLLTERNNLITERNDLVAERTNLASRYPELTAQSGTLFFDTGSGYNENEKQDFSFTGNEVEIFCQVPENTVAVRLDPVEGYGCIISNPEILSYGGIVKFEPINGYKNDDGDIVFANTDPQVELHGAAYWLKIKYRVLSFSDFSHFRVLDDYVAATRERDGLVAERDGLAAERDGLVAERNGLAAERDGLVAERNGLLAERDGLITERNRLIAGCNGLVIERDGLINSRSWRFTKPLREFGAFVRRNKALYLFAKGLLSLKRNGIKETIKKVMNYKRRKSLPQLLPLTTDTLLLESERVTQESTIFPKKIKISIITPLYNTPEQFLREMIDSVRSQTYSNWELCLADGSDEEHKYIKIICKDYAKKEKRIKYKKLRKNCGISGNSNKAIAMSSGDYLGLLDHDDVLNPSALYEVMKAICYEDADFIYTDEAIFTNTNILCCHHKPDYAIDTLRSSNYICHFSVFSRKLMNQAGTFRNEFDGSQDYDLTLRYTDIASKIVHIPKLLYFWRSHDESVATDIGNKMYAITAAKNAIREHLKRYGISAQIESTKLNICFYRLIYALVGRPLVSIIILNKDNVSMLQNCLSSIIEKTTYDNYEIIIVENNSTEDETFTYYEELKQYANVHVLYWEGKGFNYSELNNFAFQYAKGTQLVFLNNDVEIITPNWIEEMLMYSQRSDVGAVGIKLYFSDDTIQHAGVILGTGVIALHLFYGAPRDTIGYMWKLHSVQNLSAVTAACMMIKKTVFENVGFFTPDFFASYNDVDLCLKLRQAGYLIVWTPFAEAYHHESKSRGYYDTQEKQAVFDMEKTMFKERWAKELAAGDPYYNCNFSLDGADYSLK